MELNDNFINAIFEYIFTDFRGLFQLSIYDINFISLAICRL